MMELASRPRRRPQDRIRLVLAGLWVFDALLQLQVAMFTRAFTDDLELNVMAQPAWLAHGILSVVRFLAPHIALWNVAFVLVQVGLGIGIAWRRTTKAALLASFVWAAGVWIVGEGMGGLLTGFASIAFGAPGAVVLYVLLGLLVWPTGRPEGATVASEGLLGDRGTRWLWALLWCGGAYLQVRPVRYLSLNYRVYANFQELSVGEPGWLAHLDLTLGRVAQHWGSEMSFAFVGVAMVVGLGVLAGVGTRTLLTASMVMSAVFWVFGQNFGALLTGSSSDPQTAPMFVLLAACLYPARSGPADERPHRHTGRRAGLGSAH